VPAELFVDTSAWYALALPRDPAHVRLARTLRDRVSRGVRIVITNLIVAETHALLLRRVGRGPAEAFARVVCGPPNLVVSSTPELEAAALDEWIGRFDDQDFSLADAVSFAVMAERGIREALTQDRQFATAGFVVVPAGR
jgi:predicted nucleic acid-binding protein